MEQQIFPSFMESPAILILQILTLVQFIIKVIFFLVILVIVIMEEMLE